MSSPAVIPFESFISVNKSLKTPIYLQLAQQVINAIQRGYLIANTKLPGSRRIAEIFNLHRKTVIAAYEELAAQGWIEIIPNKGAIILPSVKQKVRQKPYTQSVSLAGYPEKTAFTFSVSNLLDNPVDTSEVALQLNDGQPDYRLTQLSYLSSLYSAAMKRKSVAQRLYTQNTNFKTQLSNYLNQSRGLHISEQNICISKSSEMNLYLVARTLLNTGDFVAVAHPGHFAANMVFQNAGASLITIPIDEEGIDVNYLREQVKRTKIRMLYITPHHHYPTTVNLSGRRRVELLDLAKNYDIVIVEDDYDYDFHFEKNNILPMASADVDGLVIYLGTFGKSLAPAFSCGFIVAPRNLIKEIEKYANLLSRNKDIIMEQVLAEMISEGDMHRHLRKSLQVYNERRIFCCEQLQNNLKDEIIFSKPQSGLAIWVNFKNKFSLVKLAQCCEKRGLFIPKNLLYQDRKTSAIRFGYGHLNIEEIANAVNILKISLWAVQKEKR